MTYIKHKVFAYITNRQRLLLFRHVYAPEAGIQVPAGTLEVGESPEEGVLRQPGFLHCTRSLTVNNPVLKWVVS